MKDLSVKAAAYVAVLIAIIFSLNFRPYPYADDWAYVSPLGLEWPEAFRWVFEQHVDHYIPLQKIFHFTLAYLTGYDFRVLLLFNLILAFLTALCMLRVARLYRGKVSWGDIIIPLGILNLSLGYTTWAFQLQFLSSVFFASLFLYCFVLFERGAGQRPGNAGRSNGYLYCAFFSLVALALCGMNGALSALVILAGLGGWYLLSGRKTLPLTRTGLLVLLMPVLTVTTVVLAWQPTGASQTVGSVLNIAEIHFYLQTASLSSGARNMLGAGGAAGLLLMLILSGAWLYARYRKNTLDGSDAALFSVLLATQAVLLSVAVGRAVVQGGWTGVVAMHYGPLSVLSPLLLWILLSRALPGRGVALLAAGFVAVYVFSYANGLKHRFVHQNQALAHQTTVQLALKTETDIEQLVDKYTLDLTWKDEDEYKNGVVRGLRALREAGYPIYSLAPPFRTTRTSLPIGSAPDELVSGHQRVQVDNWRENGDYERTQLDGYTVWGSFVSGDTDTGSLSLRMRRGQAVFVRTGPVATNQRIVVLANGIQNDYPMPLSQAYTLLVFDSPILPEHFQVIFHDDGDGWGEWAAIALKRE
ncbi:hypothetical protein H0A73_12135 [Alcaligenaceae bacterium]|nr:hypothetical protein [Alcaligenaceae bacterium]